MIVKSNSGDLKSREVFSFRSTYMRVASVTFPKKPKQSVSSIDANVEEAIAAIVSLSSASPDLVCLPEGFLYAGMDPNSAATFALPSDSPTLTRFAKLASDFGFYLAVPIYERRATAIHNAVLVFDRSGKAITTYRKSVLWPSNDLFNAFEGCAEPGHGGAPIPTEFGPVGIQVCMEVQWAGSWRLLKRQGVRLILFPSEQSGGMLIRHRAWQTRAYIVSAVSKGGPSQVVDPVGNVVAEWWPDTICPVFDVGLTFELVHFDHNEQKLKELASAYRRRLEIATHWHERLFQITSCDPALDLPSVLRERNILTLDQYLNRVKTANDVVRRISSVHDSSSKTPIKRSARKVSVIIPCLGVPPTLSACLESLRSQETTHEIEIIVVFNGPGAEDIDFEWNGVKIVRVPKKGPAAARNAGVRASTGDILAFLDSDCIATPKWIDSAVQIILKSRGRCILAGGIIRSNTPHNWISLYDSVTFLQQEQYVRRSQAFVTANLFVPRQLFDLVGFFDERFEEAACEDWEWASRARRRGISVVYEGRAAVAHPCMSKLNQLQAKVERLARGELVLKSRNRRYISQPQFFEIFRSQLLRAAKNSTLSTTDKLRVMSVGVPVAYWSWRAARRFRLPAKGRRQLSNVKQE